MKKNYASKLKNFLLCSVISLSLNAQQIEHHATCGTESPGLEWENWMQESIKKFKSLPESERTRGFVIPVVVHVLYKTGQSVGNTPNLKLGQVQAQIDVLNECMKGLTPGNSSLPAPFSAVDADNIDIQFCLATKDPNGNTLAEPGIDRIDWQNKGWSDPSTLSFNQIQSYFNGTIKPASIWDPNKYFNIWTADFTENTGLLGYAMFPAASTLTGIPSGTGTASNDGVVMGSNVFGNKSKYSNGYYSVKYPQHCYGITVAHEVGHWLGLRHISGDAACSNDYCNDTPPQKGGNLGCGSGLNWGCPSYPFQANQCSGNSNGEMFMNYMDYSNDQCRSLFTGDQETRMLTAMQNATYRKNLGTHGLCGTTAAPVADFGQPSPVCEKKNVSLSDASTNSPTAWTWTLTGGTPASSNAQNPTVVYNAPGTYTITLVSSNSGGASSPVSKTITINAAPATPTVSLNGVVLTSSATTGNQWYYNGGIISGAVNQTHTATQNGNYYVVVTNSNGCTAQSSATNVTGVGIVDINKDGIFAMYPNPTSGEVNLQLPDEYKSKEITIIVSDVVGRIVWTKEVQTTVNTAALNLSTLSRGLYTLQIIQNNELIAVGRLVKE